MTVIIKLIAKILNKLYGYEGVNLLFRILPSKMTIKILKMYGATIGENVRIQSPFLIHNADLETPIYKNLTIGNDSYIGRDCIFDLMEKISIGAQVTISHRAVLNTHTDAGKSPLSQSRLEKTKGEIVIEDGTYIGSNVTILSNVTIGKETIIGTRSLVNKSIQGKVTAFGVPCKVKTINK